MHCIISVRVSLLFPSCALQDRYQFCLFERTDAKMKKGVLVRVSLLLHLPRLDVTCLEISLSLILLDNGQNQVPPSRDFKNRELQPRQETGDGFSCVQPGLPIFEYRLPHSFWNTTRDLKESMYFGFSAVYTDEQNGYFPVLRGILRWEMAQTDGIDGVGE